jgi:hypothetical protein
MELENIVDICVNHILSSVRVAYGNEMGIFGEFVHNHQNNIFFLELLEGLQQSPWKYETMPYQEQVKVTTDLGKGCFLIYFSGR